MKKYKKDIIRETTIEFLKSFFDLTTPFFEASSVYRKSTREYLQTRSIEKAQFSKKIHYLKEKGLIDEFVEGKDKFYEISTKGREIFQKFSYKDIYINHPDVWDGKWRIVIFDVPEKLRVGRDVLREKLIQLGFYQIQKSVYAHPFECSEVILFLSEQLLISKYVLIMISEIIQGENDIIKDFLDRNILTKNSLISSKHKKY